jgi:HPt (histidine-containing phosphotransfer) domain-containing protein
VQMKPPAQSGKPAEEALSRAIDLLWSRFLPEIKERVAILEAAAASVAAKQLTKSRREKAHAAAHKLAGVLGTFNLTRGTVLARELEMTYSRENSPGPDSGERLAAIAAELRTMVENRPTTS